MLYMNRMPDEWKKSVLKRIGDNIHKKRLAAGWTLNGMYARTGIFAQTLFYWETAQRSPKIEMLLWLCKTTGWKFSEIVGNPREEVLRGAQDARRGAPLTREG